MLLLAGTSSFASPATAIDSSPFYDVPTASVAFDAVNWAHSTELVTGYNGMFSPNNNMTRAQFALVLYRYDGEPPAESSGMFLDVAPDRPSYRAITWAHESGIVTGAAGRFNPDDSMTRAQMVLMLHRYSEYKEIATPADPNVLNMFTDSESISPVATEAMSWAVTQGLMTGSAGRLLPNNAITRAAVVLILYRFDGNTDQPPYIDDNIRTNLDPNRPMVALTYDDGPSAFTIPILDTLQQHGAVATFYVTGNRVHSHRDTVLRAFNDGNEIASHAWSHRDLTGLSAANIRTELANTNTAIEAVTGRPPTNMRPPYGHHNSRVRSVAAELGLPIILWSVDPADWRTQNATTIHNFVMANVNDRDIILLHDMTSHTAAATRLLVPALISSGYQLVTVSELMFYSNITPVPGQVYTSGKG